MYKIIKSLLFAYVPLLSGFLLNIFAIKLGDDSYCYFFEFQVYVLVVYTICNGSLRSIVEQNSNFSIIAKIRWFSAIVFCGVSFGIFCSFFYEGIQASVACLCLVLVFKKTNDLVYEVNSLAIVYYERRAFLKWYIPLVEICLLSAVVIKLQDISYEQVIIIGFCYFGLTISCLGMYRNGLLCEEKECQVGVIGKEKYLLLLYAIFFSFWGIVPRYVLVSFSVDEVVAYFGKSIIFYHFLPGVITLCVRKKCSYDIAMCGFLFLIHWISLVFLLPFLYRLLGVVYPSSQSGALVMTVFVVSIVAIQIVNNKYSLLDKNEVVKRIIFLLSSVGIVWVCLVYLDIRLASIDDFWIVVLALPSFYLSCIIISNYRRVKSCEQNVIEGVV